MSAPQLRLLPALLVSLALTAVPTGARAQSISLSRLDVELTALVDSLAPSMVVVGGRHSGVCVSPKGFVLTDLAVAEDLRQKALATVEVAFPDQKRFPARVVASDAATGTALLRIEGRRSFAAVRPGNSADLEAGHLVLTVGNSFGSANESEPAATLGVLAAVHRDHQGGIDLLETSAATNVGQEGGPYFNVRGDLIGIERDMPRLDDLTTLTPIERIALAYAQKVPGETIFDTPRLLAAPQTPLQTLSRALAIAARRARSGGATIRVVDPLPNAAPDGATGAATDSVAPPPILEAPRRRWFGATVVDPSGFLLCALDLLPDPAYRLEALFDSGRRVELEVRTRDQKAGLALLAAKDFARQDPLPMHELRPDAPAVGSFVLALAAPHDPSRGPSPFVTFGLVSARSQLDPYRDALQTDAGVGPKNAGGALVDLRGRRLGVVLPAIPGLGANSGLGFAMPNARIAAMLERWKQGGVLEPGYLGVEFADTPKGLEIRNVVEGQPAERAGIAIGDVVVRLDRTAITRQADASAFLAREKFAGDELLVVVKRGGLEVECRLTLGKRP
jgi:S1-C subfamily serine protease